MLSKSSPMWRFVLPWICETNVDSDQNGAKPVSLKDTIGCTVLHCVCLFTWFQQHQTWGLQHLTKKMAGDVKKNIHHQQKQKNGLFNFSTTLPFSRPKSWSNPTWFYSSYLHHWIPSPPPHPSTPAVNQQIFMWHLGCLRRDILGQKKQLSRGKRQFFRHGSRCIEGWQY